MTPAVAGAGLGLVAVAGGWLAVVMSPPVRRPRLDDRLAAYLQDTPRPSRLLSDARLLTPFPTVERLLGPPIRDLARWVDSTIGGALSVRRRLAHAGRDMTVEQFRVEQVVWGLSGLFAGLFLAVVSAARGSGANPVAFLILAAGLMVSGIVVRDRLLTNEVRRREECMVAEFPTVAELLALAVAAGEGPVGALERVTSLSNGELSRELGNALADARSGSSVVTALERAASHTSLPALARFVDGMAIAVERGTPLAEVLRAQAADVREQGRRALLEAAGRKEIAMLVPVVFMVLPVTVIFALFPGFYGLQLAVP
jgi:tight adherence protein C